MILFNINPRNTSFLFFGYVWIIGFSLDHYLICLFYFKLDIVFNMLENIICFKIHIHNLSEIAITSRNCLQSGGVNKNERGDEGVKCPHGHASLGLLHLSFY